MCVCACACVYVCEPLHAIWSELTYNTNQQDGITDYVVTDELIAQIAVMIQW